MAEDRQAEDTTEGQGGVFGNLPSARPGVRSPRRGKDPAERGVRGARAASERATSAPKASRKPTASPPGRRSPPPPRPEPASPGTAGAQGGGVEDLAWAGITVAAEAATLGVRLLSRAVEAVRKPSDRR